MNDIKRAELIKEAHASLDKIETILNNIIAAAKAKTLSKAA